MRKSGEDSAQPVSPACLAEAASRLCRGEVVALVTETYYALAADARQPDALVSLLALKGRQAERTLSLLIEPEMLPALVTEIPPAARRLMAAHWPGPLTLALPAQPCLPEPLVQSGCVAVRVCPDPTARALVRAFGGPITATSCNPAGAPPARTHLEVRSYFPSLFIFGEGPTPGGLPSTLVRVTADGLSLLRPGPVEIDLDKDSDPKELHG